jgi:hypothetical protein
LNNPLKPSALPPQANGAGIHDWAQLAISEGENFLASQSGYGQIDEIIRGIMGTSHEDKLRPSTISQLALNHFGKCALDLASSLTDIKPFWIYKVSNTRYEPQAEMGQKLASAWWSSPLGIDLKFCDVIKYTLAAGSGYAHLVWSKQAQDLDLLPEDPRDVLPIRPSDMLSVQNCFGIVLRRERTVNYLRALYPQFANRIHADREGSYAAMANRAAYQRTLSSLGLVSGFMQNMYNSVLGGKPKGTSLSIPVADLYTIYVHDDSLNRTGADVMMGDAETNSSYVVRPGDALYPRGRLVIMVRSCKEPLYDGPNPYWHGLFPCPKLTLDPWPWSWLGKSPLKDLLPAQKEIDLTARGVSDLFQKLWRPDLIADSKNISKAAADRIDTRRAGLRLRVNPVAGQGIKYEWPQMQGVTIAMEWMKALVEEMKELSGTQELSSLVQLGQLPSSETIERLVESQSPAVRIRSRAMEVYMREVAMITLMNFFQFRTQAQRMAILGPKGVTFEDYDFDPGNLIPDMGDISRPRYDRAREFIKSFAFQIAPGSLLSAASVTEKMMYLQLTRMGACDIATMLEKLDVPNIGVPDEAGSTIFQRLQWQAAQQVGLAVGPAGASAAGRKATGQQMPQMRPDGRISESG